MADRKISELTALTAPAAGDYLPIVDISEAAAVSRNKRITIEELFRGIPLGTAAAPSIAIEGDENTGIYSPGADQLSVTTGGTERLRIDSSGRLGLGTSSPALPLHVEASTDGPQTLAYLVNASTGGTNETAALAFGLKGTAGTGVCRIVAGKDSDFSSAANVDSFLAFNTTLNDTEGERVRITSAGNVGIGTTSPSRLLAVSATNPAATIISTSTTGQCTLFFGDSDSDARGAVTYENNGDALGLWTAGGEKARIDSSGRLLVGTSSAGSVLTKTIELHAAGTGTNQPAYQIYSYPGASADNVGYFQFFKSRGTTVGTNTIVANNDRLGMVRWSGADGTAYVSAAEIYAEVDGTPGTNDMPGRLVFSTTADGASSPTERMRITQAGGVRLPDVYNQTIALGANVFIDTDGTLKRATSSIKYKTDVETLQDSYADAILACRPVWYRSTNASDNPDWGWWGFIAEEVAEIDPRLVQWKTVEQVINEDGSRDTVPLDTPEPENVAYDRFVPHLLNLIKRQKDQIEAMEARLSALEAQ